MTLNQGSRQPLPPPMPAPASPGGSPTVAAHTRATDLRPARKSLSPYVLAWCAIGLLAAAYLTALAVRPELVTEHLPAFRPGEPDGNQGQQAMSKAVAEVQTLRQSVSQVQLDVAKIKAAVSVTEQRQEVIEKTLGARLTTLEEKITFSAPIVATARPGAATLAAKTGGARPEGSSNSGGPIEGSQLAQALTIGAVPPIETGSIVSTSAAAALPKAVDAKPPQAAAAVPAAPSQPAAVAATTTPEPTAAATLVGFGPAVVTPTKEPVGLRISNGTSLDALRLSWSLLADRHAAQLKNMEARYVTRAPVADGEPSFELVAGPVRSPAEAKRICKALAAKNVPCQIGTFEGAGL